MVHPNSLANLKPAAPWKKGESPNPGGRPIGALNTLSSAFIKDFMNHYNEHGKEAIDALCADKPDKYVELAAKLALSVIPKEINITKESVLDDLSRDDVANLLSALRTINSIAIGAGNKASADGHPGELSPVH